MAGAFAVVRRERRHRARGRAAVSARHRPCAVRHRIAARPASSPACSPALVAADDHGATSSSGRTRRTGRSRSGCSGSRFAAWAAAASTPRLQTRRTRWPLGSREASRCSSGSTSRLPSCSAALPILALVSGRAPDAVRRRASSRHSPSTQSHLAIVGPERIARVVERSPRSGPGRYLRSRRPIWDYPGSLLARRRCSSRLLLLVVGAVSRAGAGGATSCARRSSRPALFSLGAAAADLSRDGPVPHPAVRHRAAEPAARRSCCSSRVGVAGAGARPSRLRCIAVGRESSWGAAHYGRLLGRSLRGRCATSAARIAGSTTTTAPARESSVERARSSRTPGRLAVRRARRTSGARTTVRRTCTSCSASSGRPRTTWR